jgi:hypothetical protein
MPRLIKRRWLWGSLLLAAVLGVAYVVVPVSKDRISHATCDKIQVGWSVAQVENLLGEFDVQAETVRLHEGRYEEEKLFRISPARQFPHRQRPRPLARTQRKMVKSPLPIERGRYHRNWKVRYQPWPVPPLMVIRGFSRGILPFHAENPQDRG